MVGFMESLMLHQVGAIPIRSDEANALFILLITSRETKRWIVPKGWPMADAGPSGLQGRCHRGT